MAEKMVRRQYGSRMIVVIAIVGMLVLSILATTWQALRIGRNVQTARGDVTTFVAAYLEALRAEDRDALAAMVAPDADPAWLAVVQREPRRLFFPLTAWRVERVAALNEGAITQVSLRGVVEEEGIPVHAYWRLFFMRDGTQWRPTFPLVSQTWGPKTTLAFTEGVRMTYRLDEARDVPSTVSDLFLLKRDMELIAGHPFERSIHLIVDPLEPFEALQIDERSDEIQIALRSPWTSYGFLAPESELRARVAWGMFQMMPVDEVRPRAALRAVTRFWVGEVNEIHPFFDVALVKAVGADEEVPRLGDVLSGRASEEVQTTAWLWLLSEGVTGEDVVQILALDQAEAIMEGIAERLAMSPARVEQAWAQAFRVRFAR